MYAQHWVLFGIVIANIAAVLFGAIAMLAQQSLQASVIASAFIILVLLIFLAK